MLSDVILIMVKQKVIEVRRFLRKSSGELAFLNNIIGVFEYETDNKGNTIGKIWERE
jgi:hypothetical protein